MSFSLPIPIELTRRKIQWYIAIIREETTRLVNSLSLGERDRILRRGQETAGYFGYFWLECNLPSGPAFDNITLAQLSSIEFAALDRIFARAFQKRG